MNEIELVMLKCKGCGENLDRGNSSLFFYCSSCNKGNYLENEEIYPVETSFYEVDLPGGISDSGKAFPFWTFNAKLEDISIESNATLTSIFNSVTGKARDDSKPVTIHSGSEFLMFVPAWNIFLEKAKQVGKELTLNWNNIDPVSSSFKPFEEVVRLPGDARDFAEFMFLSAVIEHPDLVKNLSYKLTLENPAMTIISKK